MFLNFKIIFFQATALNIEIPTEKSHILLFGNIFYKNSAANSALFTIVSSDFSIMEQNKFIENYCSSITPFQRDMGTSPANAKGIGLCPIHMKSTTVEAMIFFRNNTFLNNFALSKGFFS